jgi:hypothetical protein
MISVRILRQGIGLLTQYMSIYQDSPVLVPHSGLELVQPDGAIDSHSLSLHTLDPDCQLMGSP